MISSMRSRSTIALSFRCISDYAEVLLLLKRRCRSQVIRKTTMIIARVGRMMLIMVPAIEAANSPVDTTGLARPPVLAVDAPRTITLDPWTRPATPPPAIMARDQRRKGETSPTIDAVAMVPATIAAGVAIVSSILSSQGI